MQRCSLCILCSRSRSRPPQLAIHCRLRLLQQSLQQGRSHSHSGSQSSQRLPGLRMQQRHAAVVQQPGTGAQLISAQAAGCAALQAACCACACRRCRPGAAPSSCRGSRGSSSSSSSSSLSLLLLLPQPLCLCSLQLPLLLIPVCCALLCLHCLCAAGLCQQQLQLCTAHCCAASGCLCCRAHCCCPSEPSSCSCSSRAAPCSASTSSCCSLLLQSPAASSSSAQPQAATLASPVREGACLPLPLPLLLLQLLLPAEVQLISSQGHAPSASKGASCSRGALTASAPLLPLTVAVPSAALLLLRASPASSAAPGPAARMRQHGRGTEGWRPQEAPQSSSACCSHTGLPSSAQAALRCQHVQQSPAEAQEGPPVQGRWQHWQGCAGQLWQLLPQGHCCWSRGCRSRGCWSRGCRSRWRCWRDWRRWRSQRHRRGLLCLLQSGLLRERLQLCRQQLCAVAIEVVLQPATANGAPGTGSSCQHQAPAASCSGLHCCTGCSMQHAGA
jgi:hypothetical protein